MHIIELSNVLKPLKVSVFQLDPLQWAMLVLEMVPS
jgi:hypothetical protein